MPREIALFDALTPSLLPVLLLSLILHAALDRLLGWCGVYRYVWHPPLFRFSCFVCIFCAGGMLVVR